MRLSNELVGQLEPLIQEFPTYLWALLRFRHGHLHNRKAVYRALRLKRRLVHQRTATPGPRVQCRRSRTTQPNRRWAMDVTHVPCGQDGWRHLTAVIDCYDREIVGYEFALRGRAQEAERAIEAACLARFGTLRPVGSTSVLRSDNGLIFQSRRFRVFRLIGLQESVKRLVGRGLRGGHPDFVQPGLGFRLEALG